MHEDFDQWNTVKKSVQEKRDFSGLHQRELWWVTFGINVGVEIGGKQDAFERPAIVLRKFNNQMTWVVPVTSQEKDGPFYERFMLGESVYFAAITQLRTLSTKRFLRKIGMIPNLILNVCNRRSHCLPLWTKPRTEAGFLGGLSHNPHNYNHSVILRKLMRQFLPTILVVKVRYIPRPLQSSDEPWVPLNTRHHRGSRVP